MNLLSCLLAALRRLRTRWTLWRAGPRVSAGPDLHLGARCRLWAPQRIAFGQAVYVGKDVHIECNAEIGDFALIADRVALVGRQDHDFHVSGVPMRFTPQISPTMVAMPASLSWAARGRDLRAAAGVFSKACWAMPDAPLMASKFLTSEIGRAHV